MKGLIRGATVSDIPDMVRMAEAFHSKTNAPGFVVEDFIRTTTEMMFSDISVILIYKEDGKMLGSIGGVLAQWFTSKKTVMAYESWWFVDPDARGKGVAKGLLDAFTDWAQGLGAEKVVMVEFAGDLKPMGNYYKRKGFEPLETRYMTDI